MAKPGTGSVFVLVIALTVTGVFFIDFCNLVFACGCHSLWDGGASHCNIHNPAAKHCPWCSVGNSGFAMVFLGIAAPQTLLSFRPRRWGVLKRLAASLTAFPVVGLMIALGMGWHQGYWG